MKSGWTGVACTWALALAACGGGGGGGSGTDVVAAAPSPSSGAPAVAAGPASPAPAPTPAPGPGPASAPAPTPAPASSPAPAPTPAPAPAPTTSAQLIATSGPQASPTQSEPNIAVQADGHAALAWKATDSVCWRIVTAQGAPQGDNTCMVALRSYQPVTVAALGTGFVLVWTEADTDAYDTPYTMKWMTLSATGASGAVRSMPAGTSSAGLSSATLKSGEAVLLQSLAAVTGHRLLRIDTGGNMTVVQAQIEAPASPSNIPAGGRVTALADGGFLLTWDESDPLRFRSIHMRFFDAAFQPRSGILVKPGATEELSAMPSALPDGGFVMLWSGGGTGVGVQRFDANGVAIGPRTMLDPAWLQSSPDTCFTPRPYTCFPSQDGVALTATADGGWLAFWHNKNPHGGWQGTFAERFAADGSAVSAPTQLAVPTPDMRSNPLRLVAPTSGDAGFFFTWPNVDSDYQAGIYTTNVWLQRFGGDAVR